MLVKIQGPVDFVNSIFGNSIFALGEFLNCFVLLGGYLTNVWSCACAISVVTCLFCFVSSRRLFA